MRLGLLTGHLLWSWSTSRFLWLKNKHLFKHVGKVHIHVSYPLLRERLLFLKTYHDFMNQNLVNFGISEWCCFYLCIISFAISRTPNLITYPQMRGSLAVSIDETRSGNLLILILNILWTQFLTFTHLVLTLGGLQLVDNRMNNI